MIEVMLPIAPAEPAPPAREFHRGHAPLGAVATLSPRPEMPLLAAAQALELLNRYRKLVTALVGRAIARAWDDGRLVFPNEGALPFHGEVTGLLGRTAGAARAEVAIAEDQVARASEEARAAEDQAGPGLSPLTALATEFGLSPLARVLLLLIGGPSLWGEFARLYGILGNDEGRPLVDELLLVQILAGQVDRHEIARELDRDAPLVRHGLIRCREGRMRPFLALTCEPIVLRLLCAADCRSGLDDLELVPATRGFDELLIPAPTKDAISRAFATAPAGPGRVVVRGRTGSGRHTLLATLAKAANRSLGVIDATAILRDLRGRLDRLRVALRRAHLLGFLPCVDGLDALPADDRAARDVVAQVLDDHPGPLAVRLPWDGEPMLAPGYVQIDLPVLSIVQRTACWHFLLAERALFVREPEELADRYSVGPGVVARACAQVVAAQDSAPGGDGIPAGVAADAAAPLESAVRQYLDTRLKATATRVQRLATWSRVVLPPDIQESVLELIARIKHRRTVYDTWGYNSVLTTSRGVTALFQGGPGTGKTLVASAIASELGMDLYRVDLSRVMSKWIGETEQNLAKLFDAAEDGHAIILFDEADSLFAKRTEVRSSVDRYANLEVNYLLQRFDTFEGIAILTTNFGTSIDSAFKRRLSFRLTFPFPDEEAREALWRSHISPGIPRGGEIDFAELARRYRLSGGYIRNAAVRAAFLAAEEHSALTQDHLERAIKAEFREIGKIGEGGILE
jgi:AAA+ superfamily predicted ATPase